MPALLLTGATGLLGGELVPRLLAARPDRRVMVLVRPGKSVPDVSVLAGDLRAPGLGLDASQLAACERSLTEIVHCAAETRFDRPLEEARALNVGGTANLLDLARRCRQLEKFAHLSTVYVAGRTAGQIPEARLPRPACFSNTYQESKLEAEELVGEAARDVPAAIFRLSSIIGDSRTGEVRQFNYVHQLLKLFPRSPLPLAPGEPEAPVDLIPSDWAIPALAYLIESRFEPGRVYHLTAGPDRSLKVRELIELAIRAFESHPQGQRWLPIRVPRLVGLTEYEQFVEKSRRDGDRLLNELLRVLGLFLPHLGIHQAFENRRTTADLEGSGLEFPPLREAFAKVAAYCLETDWGRRR